MERRVKINLEVLFTTKEDMFKTAQKTTHKITEKIEEILKEAAAENIRVIGSTEEYSDEKYFKCPRCRGLSTAEEWNKATRDEFGGNITEIQDKEDCYEHDCIFICPSCNGEFYIDDILSISKIEK